MPATEQTWRDLKRTHVVFGVTSVLMLLATVWMFMDDHEREWKPIQDFYQTRLETWSTQARIYESLAGDYRDGFDAREQVLAAQQAEDLNTTLLDLFVAELRFAAAPQAPEDANEFHARLMEQASAALNLNRDVRDLTVEEANLAKDIALAGVRSASRKASLERQQAVVLKRLAELRPKLKSQFADLRTKLGQMPESLTNVALQGKRQNLEKAVQKYKEVQSGETPKSNAAPEEAEAAADDTAKDDLAQLQQAKVAARVDLLGLLNEVIATARFREENLQRDLKFRRADLDVVKSDHGLLVGAGAKAEELAAMQSRIDAVTADVNNLAGQYEAANVHRKRLGDILRGVTAGVDSAQKARDQYQADVDRLQNSLEEAQANLRKAIVRAPVLDAFDTSNREIKQIWLPKLTINYNFSHVARFDRCVTCHLGIDKTAPGSPSKPGYEAAHVVEGLELPTPNSNPLEDLQNDIGELPSDDVDTVLLQIYGLHLSREGLFGEDEVMIETVLPETPAAMARLARGDVIQYINDVKVTGRGVAVRYLLERVEWGKPLRLTVRRGVPHPYASHPRLDLYGGSMSPHPFTKIGCTICHDGQGSATSFKWASHTPNTMKQTEQWAHQYGWFNNHHWIFPMPAKRFNESLCLKCHHEVNELRASERFPDPPAPQLMKGFDTIRTFGCFGCHEINGYNGPDQTIGPDLRLEPNYSGVAAALAVNPDLDEQGVKLRIAALFGPKVEIQDNAPADESLRAFYDELQASARPLVQQPFDDAARHKLMALLEADFGRRRDGGKSLLNDRLLKLRAVLADSETPGLMRRVGPSLRHVASKLDREFIYNQVREPKHFRPSSRMPQFFGQYAHLETSHLHQGGHAADSALDDQQNSDQQNSEHSAEPDKTKRYEHVEVSAITKFLLTASQPFSYIGPDKRVTEKPSAEHGKFLFQTRGCLACHTHKDFPEMKETQGPNLTGLGSKLTSPQSKRWLYSWLRNPTHYNARTRMPNLFLEPVDVQPAPAPAAAQPKEGDAAKPAAPKNAPTKVTDPAADLVEFLLSSKEAWEPRSAEFNDDETLRELALEHLSGAFTRRQAERYVESGIPDSMASELKGDEIELVGEITSPQQRRAKLLTYVGRKSVSKYGCSGCHDIPGFEDAKSIGTGLADWGRKEPSKLAFEQVTQYLHQQEHQAGSENEGAASPGNATRAYFINAINSHMREGFIWEKLHEPRSFDFEKTANKGYNERLRMPKFPFDEDQIEAVMTFVLGLVAEPPASEFVYKPAPRREAIVQGERLLIKYNCIGCHTVEMGKWDFEFPPDYDFYASHSAPGVYPFLLRQPSSEAVANSLQEDRRGWLSASVTGMYFRDENGELPELEDDEGRTLLSVELWQDAVINGQPWYASEQAPVVPAWITSEKPAFGGALFSYIPKVLLANRTTPAVNHPTGKYREFYAWGPPPLLNEGRKVQSDWLHDFLLDPYSIRPAAVLRMPKFNMSPDEATKFANYFAARDHATYPYVSNPRRNEAYLERENKEVPGRLDDAMKLITNKGVCVSCHSLGTFNAQGPPDKRAPNLDHVYQRIRPEFLRDWIAKPSTLLPYTAMPQNIKYGDPKTAKAQFTVGVGPLFSNDADSAHAKQLQSVEQIEALVDVLQNYDRYLNQHEKVEVNEPPKEAKAEAEAAK